MTKYKVRDSATQYQMSGEYETSANNMSRPFSLCRYDQLINIPNHVTITIYSHGLYSKPQAYTMFTEGCHESYIVQYQTCHIANTGLAVSLVRTA